MDLLPIPAYNNTAALQHAIESVYAQVRCVWGGGRG
jgi:hypothetical protein